jgi:hypothetical protein
VIATIFRVLFALVDLDHCARWTAVGDRLVCAEVRLDAACVVSGWHETAQGIPVCSRACEGGEPVS